MSLCQKKIYRSSNGSSFIRTEHELKTALENLNGRSIEDEVNQNKTKWFSNPRFGLYDKMTKKTLKSIIRDTNFTDDALYTFMAAVESIVNGTSITSGSKILDNHEVLTPSHFIFGQRSNNVAIINNDKVDAALKQKW